MRSEGECEGTDTETGDKTPDLHAVVLEHKEDADGPHDDPTELPHERNELVVELGLCLFSLNLPDTGGNIDDSRSDEDTR